MSPYLRLGLTCCLPLLFSTLSIACPPQADWFPQPKPLDPPTGEVIHVDSVEKLFAATESVKPGGTILVADGHYALPRYFDITTDNVTLRSASGDRHKVVLDAASSRHGELIGITSCEGVTIADLTVQNVKFNGIKINSDRNTHRVTVHNCVLHNIWQRGVKAPGIRDDDPKLRPRECRIQYCLFYNDRPKQFSDDETDTAKSFNGNYIGGIDVKSTSDWVISDNVFLGIQGRTREGRGCIYVSSHGRRCVIERNIFLDSDIGIAVGNPAIDFSKFHARECIVRDNLVVNCPESGILACYTQDCEITGNTVIEPNSSRGRLIWVQNVNDGLVVADNLLIGGEVLVTSQSKLNLRDNVVYQSLAQAANANDTGAGQKAVAVAQVSQAVDLPQQYAKQKAEQQVALTKPGQQPADTIEAMREVHQGFQGQEGYVAQFGDSITYSMAFWTAIGWASPDEYLTADDGLAKTPANSRWRDYVKGTRDKGPDHANYSGWKVGQLNKAVDGVLTRDKPEVAIIMIGTNDISGGKVPDSYQGTLKEVVQKCLNAHCVPILNTIPPRRGRDQAVADANEIIRGIAAEMNVPLADFHAECIRLRPGDSWDGTIMSRDGVHPSGGKTHIYTEDNMKNCGYALRNWVNFLVLRQIYTQVLQPK